MSLHDKMTKTKLGMSTTTYRVKKEQLANIIEDAFIQKMVSLDQLKQLDRTLRGKFFAFSELNSPDKKFLLHVSWFQRGLIIHRRVWVKCYDTEEVYEWKGFSLEPIRRTVQGRMYLHPQQSFCEMCGTVLTQGTAFCPYCGTKVTEKTDDADMVGNEQNDRRCKILDKQQVREANKKIHLKGGFGKRILAVVAGMVCVGAIVIVVLICTGKLWILPTDVDYLGVPVDTVNESYHFEYYKSEDGTVMKNVLVGSNARLVDSDNNGEIDTITLEGKGVCTIWGIRIGDSIQDLEVYKVQDLDVYDKENADDDDNECLCESLGISGELEKKVSEFKDRWKCKVYEKVSKGRSGGDELLRNLIGKAKAICVYYTDDGTIQRIDYSNYKIREEVTDDDTSSTSD